MYGKKLLFVSCVSFKAWFCSKMPLKRKKIFVKKKKRERERARDVVPRKNESSIYRTKNLIKSEQGSYENMSEDR